MLPIWYWIAIIGVWFVMIVALFLRNFSHERSLHVELDRSIYKLFRNRGEVVQVNATGVYYARYEQEVVERYTENKSISVGAYLPLGRIFNRRGVQKAVNYYSDVFNILCCGHIYVTNQRTTLRSKGRTISIMHGHVNELEISRDNSMIRVAEFKGKPHYFIGDDPHQMREIYQMIREYLRVENETFQVNNPEYNYFELDYSVKEIINEIQNSNIVVEEEYHDK